MVSLKDENGFEVRIKKEEVCCVTEDYKYYVNSFEFFVNGKNLFDGILEKDKIYANVDPLYWIKDEILRSINEQKHVNIDLIEPDVEIEIMPASYYHDRVWKGCDSKCEEDNEFAVVFHIDSKNFTGDGSYLGCNISVTLFVSKEQLLKFADDIEKEYEE